MPLSLVNSLRFSTLSVLSAIMLLSVAQIQDTIHGNSRGMNLPLKLTEWRCSALHSTRQLSIITH